MRRSRNFPGRPCVSRDPRTSLALTTSATANIRPEMASCSSPARCRAITSANWYADARTHALNRSAASTRTFGQRISRHQSCHLPTAGPHPRVARHPRMMAQSMAQRVSSTPVGAPGLVTKPNTLMQPMILLVRSSGCMRFPDKNQRTAQQRTRT